MYELKAYVQNIFARLGVDIRTLSLEAGTDNIYSRSLVYKTKGGKQLAELGIVSRKLLKTLDIAQPVFFADLNWTALMKAVRKHKTLYKDVSKFPAVSRDLALLVDKGLEFAEIEKVAYATEKKLLKNVRLFDVYEGKNLEAGKKSYAVNFTLQDENKTLNDKQIDKIMSGLIRNLENKLGAKLR